MEKWLDEYLKQKPFTTADYQPEWQAHRYLINGKMFAMIGGDKEGTEILTVKLKPENGEMLREEFKDSIVPGYYMNKIN
ncbi:MAG: MmcQ/YjbR family DNA-binding protein [Streptococcaceae bacterium]|jgi:predicted DNA-binding protein (MmcQ/YjbR family)|nr:MmcQ/YjbR family DNA-binding protein [Streptococcaceae bacterium]